MDADSRTDLTAAVPYEPPPPLAGAPAAIGEVLSDRWSVAEIRRGGQAWVLIVDDLDRGGRRAIKIPLSGALVGDDELDMLLRLEPHRHTVTTLGVIEVRGQPGIVFDYAPSTLTDLIRRGHGLSLTGILQQVCAGMAHLSHVVEVAHLDLKPSNVLIDENGHAKVADFGLAQRVRIQDGRFAGARGGTWAYAAPEVLRLEPCDTRADIFSFGVLLYEACTGKLPYPFALDPDPVAQRAQLLDYYTSPGPGERQSQLYYWGQSKVTQVPVTPPGEGISVLLSSCLQQHLSERPQSFTMLAEMLARAVRRPPVETLATPLPQIDQQRRSLSLAQVLIRLDRLDEAINELNRLLSTPLPPALFETARQTAVQALTTAGRHAEATELADWR
ncbi:serine/threonine protein kinase [Streptomyces sp. NBC_00441]|uniref:serine/threonine-protein kinase n=1 Tax=Streptomyces sp. NBC_00441 TaxID=2975742 RepID=UPI002E2C35F4|nr:serine/threonine-protein kinase [Streptomyces sp. NBC_00441]